MAVNFSGSLVITGSITTTGTISMSGSIASASYANNATSASYANNATTASYANNATSASYALNATTGAYANTATSASYALNATTFNGLASSIFATTGSNTFVGNQTITGSVLQSGSFTTTGTIIAQTINVQQVTSSIVYSCGSNIFGTNISNTQQLTGSVGITGSLTIAGASSATSYNGATIFGSTIACSPIGCFATSCATSFIGGTMSGTTIYGSTAVCSPVGKFTSCIDVGGAGTFSGGVTIGNTLTINTPASATAISLWGRSADNFSALRFQSNTGATTYATIYSNASDLIFENSGSARLTISSTGAACFASSTQAGGFYANGSTTISSPFDTTRTKAYFDASNIDGATLTLVSDSVGRTIRLAATAAATYSGKIDINTSEMNIGTNVTLPFSIYTNQNSRATISSTGITSFACQVCSPSFNSSASSTLNGLLVSCNVNSNCFTGITVYNGAGAGSEASRAGIAFQAYDWVQSAIWHGRNTAAAFSGALLFGTNPDTTNLTVGGVCTRLKIDNYGIACFSCQTCTPFVVAKGIDVSSGGATNPTDACVGYGMFGYSGVGLGITAGASGGNQGIGFFVCGVERGRWISSGNLGIGTLCPSAKLVVSDGTNNILFTPAAAPIIRADSTTNFDINNQGGGVIRLYGSSGIWFRESGNEPSMIVKGGKVGIGISNPTRELHIAAPNSTLRVGPDYPVLNSSTDRDYIDLIAGGSQSIIAAPNESFLIINTGGGGASPCIDIQAGSSGGVRLTNTATSWAGISDIRAKDIIEPITNAVAKLSNLSTIIYKLKNDETNQRKIGLIAQEVNEVFPEVVDIPSDICVMWGVRYSELTPVIIKAIQEQQCTICSQASMINTLKTCLGII
jgi:hypothetical protein